MSTEYREKTYELKPEKNEIYAEGYTKSAIEDTETSIYTFDVERCEYRVTEDGHLVIHDDRNWVSVHSAKSLNILKKAIEIALARQNIELLK